MQAPEVVPPGPPPGECRAVIDIGTNSVKLLVARVDGTCVEPILEKGNQTRLGDGFYATHRLQPAAIARTAAAVAAYRGEAQTHRPARFRVLATAAAREATNRAELMAALGPAAGTEIEIITGQREAELAFRGVCSEPELARCSLLVADVGGGSTELILGEAGVRRFEHSFPLGAVRLMQSLQPPDPPAAADLQRCRTVLDAMLLEQVLPALHQAPTARSTEPLQFVGVGGTAAILACIVHGLERYDRNRIEASRIDTETLTDLTTRLWSLPLAQRRQIVGLPAERADVILTGCAIYEAFLRVLKLGTLRPSTRGLRFAALLDE